MDAKIVHKLMVDEDFYDGSHQFKLSARDNCLFVRGVIDSKTPIFLEEILNMDPFIRCVVLTHIDGSLDDLATFEAGRIIRSMGLSTYVPKYALVVSGGVELFLSGSKRFVEVGAKMGVHAWRAYSFADGVIDARELPRSSWYHTLYTSYYKEMGIDEQFYFFSIEAASHERMYYLSQDEIQAFRLLNT